MKKTFTHSLVAMFFLMALAYGEVFAQTVISGTVKDGSTGTTLPGANIIIKGTTIGTATDSNGKFSLSTTQNPPFTIEITFAGFKTAEVPVTSSEVSGLEISLMPAASLFEIEVSSNVLGIEKYSNAPVTIERIDLQQIQQAPSPDYYEALANVKGVQVMSGSLNFPAINTRGFATIANTRFVQLIDGMDSSAPLLNFPTGNIVGIGELDIESMDLLPGASSALYGPNAFNGILIMNSKSPFKYEGLSVQTKIGMTTSDAQNNETYPLRQFSLRYARAINDKFAFKMNFSMMNAEDWRGNDYTTDRNRPGSTIDLTSAPNFDGLNLYGDETQILIPIGGTFGTLDVRRTGFHEEDIIGDHVVKSLKYDGALHYKIKPNVEAIYAYRFGGGSSVYQGQEKYALRDFTQQFHKLEVRGDNFFVRGYHTVTDAGDSYNIGAMGAFANEYYSPTRTQWAPEYAQTYVLAMQGYVPGVPAGNPEAAHMAARGYADRNRPERGSTAYNQLLGSVKNNFFQRNPPGASFIDNSKLYHGEFNYQFKDKIKFAEVQIGGNVRRYDLFSDGTIFNEDPENGTNFQRITIDEFGMYTQIAKEFGKLRLTGSIRYDKNENFDGQVTPRLSAVYSVNENHFIRGSFQTGFRNPDTQAQFIYFPAATILVGSTRANAERYGIHEGGSWTDRSYQQFIGAGGTFDENGNPQGPTELLVTANLPYIQPEQLKAFEIGYKGVFSEKFYTDVNFYHSRYTNFIAAQTVRSKQETIHQGNALPVGTAFRPYVNSPEELTSYGIGLGVNYKLGRNYILTGVYDYADFNVDLDEDSEFEPQFNMPNNKFSITFGNPKVWKELGFNIAFRWQDSFLWQSAFGQGEIPAFGVLDAQVNYSIPNLKTMIKLGGTNIGGGDYRTNFGAPFVGRQYYIALTFDESLFRGR
jgi:iron complex outermembrane recepter protein